MSVLKKAKLDTNDNKSNPFFTAIGKGLSFKHINKFKTDEKSVLESLSLDPLIEAVKTCDLAVVNTVISVLNYHNIKPEGHKNYTISPLSLGRSITYCTWKAARAAIDLGLHDILNTIMCFYPPSEAYCLNLFNNTITANDTKLSAIILDNMCPVYHDVILEFVIEHQDIKIAKFLMDYGIGVSKKNMTLAIDKKNQGLINILIGLDENIASLDIASRFKIILSS